MKGATKVLRQLISTCAAPFSQKVSWTQLTTRKREDERGKERERGGKEKRDRERGQYVWAQLDYKLGRERKELSHTEKSTCKFMEI